ncbi:MAG: SPOCS domain-containing protein [Romboutsia sp.]|uniref:SPOCS domain-containing protein n=1 Tax=Romboutsia sp. TaxID=1965302 RepID=UPI003F3CC980
MLNCDYTGSTIYRFYDKCCISSENINFIGEYPQNKIEKVLSCFNDTDKWTEFFLPEIVDIPIQKPNIEGVVEIQSCVEIISQRVIKTPTVSGYTNSNGVYIPGENIPNSECTNLTGKKLIIEGLLRQKIIYTALVENQALHSANFVVPFSTFIIIDKDTALSQKFKVMPYIEDIFACKLSERSVFKNTTIFIKASKIC